ncbi:DUF5958 family protein [Streptomyces sp. NPDC003038]|uniref:DUF5958 family protein n=1 Tax=unclassified Streptomyces TaxID=2593676 RepID=UPI0033ADB5FC
MTEREVILNELAQGLRPMSQGIEWFDATGPEEQSEVLLFLRHHCVQARAVAEDGPESIRRAGLRGRPTAVDLDLGRRVWRPSVPSQRTRWSAQKEPGGAGAAAVGGGAKSGQIG